MSLLSKNPGPNSSNQSILQTEMTVSVLDSGAPSMLYSTLVTDTPASTVTPGTLAWTSDIGLVVSNGVTWGAVGSAGGGGGFGVSVSATLVASQDNLNPAGNQPGITNRYILTPASGGSTVNGLLAPGKDGFSALIVNPSSTDSITYPFHNSSTSANQFSTPQGVSAIQAPLTNAIITYVVNQWEFA